MTDQMMPWTAKGFWEKPQGVRWQVYREALCAGVPWRSLPLDGLLVLFGGPGAADLGADELWEANLPGTVETELLRRMLTGDPTAEEELRRKVAGTDQST